MTLKRIEPSVPQEAQLKVCAYARVSTENGKQGLSLENQVETYTRLIKGNPEYAFVDVYADLGISGRSDKRPAFQQMMQDARAGKIDLIITKSISRFARNTVTLLKYVRELKDLGVAVLFEENNIRTDSSEGEMMLTILASFAQEESRSFSENLRWTLRKKFEHGEGNINTSRFLGYDKDENGQLVINEKEAKIVRRIYDMYLSGMGTFQIKNKLNEEKVPTVTGALWRPGAIMYILRNEKYKGDMYLQKTYTPESVGHSVPNRGEVQSFYVTGAHEAIIDPEDWERVQELIVYNNEQRRINAHKAKFQNRYPNSGMLKCPYCGASLIRRHVFGGKIEWLCRTYIELGVNTCKGIRIRDMEIGDRVFTEPTVVEEVIENGSKHYRYTRQADFDAGIRTEETDKEKSRSVLPRVNRTRRTVIKL